jgi:Short C-terminal domain
MTNCPSCSQPADADSKFCIYCNAPIERAELQGQRLPAPEPTLRTSGVEQSKQSMNSKITIGIIILMIGVILLIISSDMTPDFNHKGGQAVENLQNITMLLGLVLLTVGGIISARGFASKRSSHQQPSPTSSLNELEKLASLKEKGVITEEEYEKKKKQILGI